MDPIVGFGWDGLPLLERLNQPVRLRTQALGRTKHGREILQQAGGAENLYYMGNHVLPSTALPTMVTTTTAATVMLQLSTPSTRQINLVEYGISFSGSPSAIQCQLRSSNTAVSATNMTAGVINVFNNPGGPASLCTTGTSNSCFYDGTSTAAPVATVQAVYDTQTLSSNTYIKQWPLAREPVVAVSNFLELCVDAAAAVNASCYYIWRE